MSVFCPKCGKRTYNEYSCDYCQYEIKKEKVLKSNYKPAQTRIHINRSNNKMNKNSILIIGMFLIITASLAYIAYDKYRERSENEKAFKYITGHDNVDDYLKSDKTKINSKFTKDVEKQMTNGLDTQKKLFENMLHKQ